MGHQNLKQFQDAMLSVGILPPFDIQLDGAIHRFYIEGDKKGSKNGWYIFFDDFISCGVFGSWKTDFSKVWCSQQLLKMNSSERFIFDKKVKEAKIQWRLEREKIQKTASVRADRIYFKSSRVNLNHPYLLRKRVQAFSAKQDHNNIVLPVVDFAGKIWSLQYCSKWKEVVFKRGFNSRTFHTSSKICFGYSIFGM